MTFKKNNYQILYSLMYSKKEINSDSNYVIFSQIVKKFLLINPKIHFFIPFPNKESGFKYDDDGTFNHPNVTRISMRMYPSRHVSIFNHDSRLWNKIKQKYAIDVFG